MHSLRKLSIAAAFALAVAPVWAQTPSETNQTEQRQQMSQHHEQDQQSIKGRVVLVNPSSVVLATDQGHQEFDIASAENKGELAENKYVEVWVAPAADGQRMQITRVAIWHNGETEASAAIRGEAGADMSADASGEQPDASAGVSEEGVSGSASGSVDDDAVADDRDVEGAQSEQDQFSSDRSAAEQDSLSAQDQLSADRDAEGDMDALPQTGTSLPLVGLIALLALAAGVATRLFIR